MSKHSVEEIKAVILGHAVGDALGVPVEFQTREGLEADPVTDMRGYGTYPVPVGSWSDDTSMTLCALDALTQESFLWDAVMVNFGRWYYWERIESEPREKYARKPKKAKLIF